MDDIYERIKGGMKAMWSLGDYAEVAVRLEGAAAALARACGVAAGDRVLDVAAGNGNFALAAARRGARVVAVDFAPRMVELGRERSLAAGVDIEWREGDAEELPFRDGNFGVAASVFGAMFAPRPERVAAEMSRVVARGGVVAMAAYTSHGFLPQYADLIREFAGGAPIPMPSPFEWGDPDTVRSRLGPYVAELQFSTGTLHFGFESMAAGRAFWQRTNAPTLALRTRLSAADFSVFMGRAEQLMVKLNMAADDGLILESEYLTTIASKR